MNDTELLIQFRDPVTKEKAYTSIIKKYQEKLYWHIRRMVVDHEDANDVSAKCVYPGMEGPGKFPGRQPAVHLALPDCHQRMPDLSWNSRKKEPL